MNTAEKVYREIIEMPVSERERLFGIIARKGFDKDIYSHEEVFDDIRRFPFSAKEAAEYLEISEITLRRWIKIGKIRCQKIGRQLAFSPEELKISKKSLHRGNPSLASKAK